MQTEPPHDGREIAAGAVSVGYCLRPARAARRPALRLGSVAVSLALLVAAQWAIVEHLPALAAGERYLLETLSKSPIARAELLGLEVPRVAFDLAVPSHRALVVWIAVSAVALAILLEARRLNQALRIVLVVEALLVLVSALSTLWTSRPAFEAEDLSILFGETAPALWVCLPPLVGLLSLAFPLRAVERLALSLCVLAWLVLACAAQQAFFAAALEQVGSVLMAPLYLTAGPLVDILGAVGITTAFLARAAGRLQRAPVPREVWSWS